MTGLCLSKHLKGRFGAVCPSNGNNFLKAEMERGKGDLIRARHALGKATPYKCSFFSANSVSSVSILVHLLNVMGDLSTTLVPDEHLMLRSFLLFHAHLCKKVVLLNLSKNFLVCDGFELKYAGVLWFSSSC